MYILYDRNQDGSLSVFLGDEKNAASVWADMAMSVLMKVKHNKGSQVVS